MTHDERVYHHLYVESKSPLENAERIASLEELVEELQAENAELRSELESVSTAAYLYGRSDLKAENAKLRELCEDMLDCIEIRAAWHRPPTEEMYEEFAQRASELGIEVDG